MVKPGSNESDNLAHVISKDTLIRRDLSQPDFIFFDECHIALDQQIKIQEKYSQSRIIGLSATPERLDGRGLDELYNHLVPGLQLSELVNLGRLSEPLYYAYYMPEIEKLRRTGTDVNAKQLSELMEQKKVYGDVIKHYKELADSKTTICFCRNIAASEETADQFCNAGYKFKSIDGRMTKKKRDELLNQLRRGEIHGLCSSDLLTYGVDIKNVECIIHLRPTDSLALYYQMNGRGLRVMEGKTKCIILDHVNNFYKFGHILSDRKWNFNAVEKVKHKIDHESVIMRCCPETFLYCTKPSCINCYNNTTGRVDKTEYLVDLQLSEMKNPVKLNERPDKEKLEYQKRINIAIKNRDTGGLLDLAKMTKRPPMWVYHMLKQSTIDNNLLHEIKRIKDYSNGWLYRITQSLS